MQNASKRETYRLHQQEIVIGLLRTPNILAKSQQRIVLLRMLSSHVNRYVLSTNAEGNQSVHLFSLFILYETDA